MHGTCIVHVVHVLAACRHSPRVAQPSVHHAKQQFVHARPCSSMYHDSNTESNPAASSNRQVANVASSSLWLLSATHPALFCGRPRTSCVCAMRLGNGQAVRTVSQPDRGPLIAPIHDKALDTVVLPGRHLLPLSPSGLSACLPGSAGGRVPAKAVGCCMMRVHDILVRTHFCCWRLDSSPCCEGKTASWPFPLMSQSIVFRAPPFPPRPFAGDCVRCQAALAMAMVRRMEGKRPLLFLESISPGMPWLCDDSTDL